MIIAVDNGNYQTKTVNHTFVSGLSQHSVKPPMADDVIEYNGSFWTLSGERFPYKKDKTLNENCFILSLFAVARELAVRNELSVMNEISLAVGLPPQHYGALKEKFAQYFKGRPLVKYVYNDVPISLAIKRVYVFPQAYAAIVTCSTEILPYQRVYIVDIGGYTTDVLLMRGGRPDLNVCHSIEMGTITMANSIALKINALHDLTITNDHIADVLAGRDTILPTEVQDAIRKEVAAHAAMTLDKLRELRVDLRSDPVVFTGGGSILLKPYLEASEMVRKAEFITDPRANAKGYERLAEAMDRRRNGGSSVEEG